VDDEIVKLSWPPRCCVPAFLGRAVAEFSSERAVVDSDDVRRAIAKATDVVLAPTDFNPWNLRTSDDDEELGVTPARARATISSVVAILGCCDDLTLKIIPITEIGFELYEEAVSDLTAAGAIVAIAFDYSALQAAIGKTPPGRRGHHVVRLSPLGRERCRKPSILSPEFRFDYSGDISVFDDSFEMVGPDSLVSWQALVRACRSIDGAFWAVMRRG